MMKWSLCFIVGIATALVLHCDFLVGPKSTKLAIDSPKEGQTVAFGDEVAIQLRANGDFLSEVKVQVTSDNGENYFDVRNSSLKISGSGEKKYTVQWIVGKEAYHQDLFSLYKEQEFGDGEDPSWKCKIKISSTKDNSVSVTSNTFTVVFKVPFFLRYPQGDETVNASDTLPVLFSMRSDSSSVIQSYYWSLQSNTWIQFITHGFTPSKRGNSFVNGRKNFIPNDPNLLEPVGDSTKILVNDYSVKRPKESGWLTIKK